VHASTKARFEEAYRDIAQRLELPGLDDPKTDVLRLVHNWLCNEINGKWIIVLDNADDIETFYPKQTRTNNKQSGNSFTSLTDYLPQSPNGSILITSRSKDAASRLAGGYHNIKEVETFGEHQALQLLRNKLQGTASDEDASDLIRTLDYIPLAITQAAAYINRHAPRITISDYLGEFHKSNKSKENLLNHDTGDLRRDKSATNSVVTAWQITFEHIRKERRCAADLLSLMSCFNPQEIPEFALRNYTQSREGRISNVKRLFSVIHHLRDSRQESAQRDFDSDITLLKAYSLISVTTEKGILKMHPLVQLCTRAWLSSSHKLEDWELSFLALTRKEFLSKKFENWIECRQLVSHVESFGLSEPSGKSMKQWIQLTVDVGSLLRQNGKYNEAEKLNRRALEGREKELGVHHIYTLRSVNNLASVLRDQGKYDEAEKLNRRALEGYEKQLGVHHIYTLVSVNYLASVLRDQGKYDEAEKLNRRALEGYEKQLGVHHLYTLVSVNNLASVLRDQGKYDEAAKLNRRALEGYEKQLGVHHIYTLEGVNNLASVLRDQGKYDEAEKLNRRALEGYEKQLGVHHIYTLGGVNKLASVLQDQGKYDEAEKLNRRALEGYEKQLGVHHLYTLVSVNDLAGVLRDQGKYDEAEKLNRRALEGREKALGVQHPDTLTSMDHLAGVLRYREKYNEAEGLVERALEGREKVLGVHHPDTLTSVSNLAGILRDQGKYDDAKKLYQRALEGRQKALGVDHPKTITSVSDLTSLLQDQEKYDETEKA
jgi:tetratricopeptide (TPR) repeat protein